MSLWPERTRTAVLIVDAQEGVMAASEDAGPVVERIRLLVDRAREASTTVVWIRHSNEELPLGSTPWQIVEALEPADGEPIVEKLYGDSFEDTDLEQQLERRGVGSLVVAGAQTDACVRSTIHGAFTRGYDVTLVADAHTTEDFRPWEPAAPSVAAVVAHTNLYWSFQRAPGRTASVLNADDVVFDAST